MIEEKTYGVTSGEIEEVEPVLDDGSGPVFKTCCYVEVKAIHPLEAKIKAVRTKEFRKWVEWQKENAESVYLHLFAREIKR